MSIIKLIDDIEKAELGRIRRAFSQHIGAIFDQKLKTQLTAPGRNDPCLNS